MNQQTANGFGKVILLGEHAAVFGRHIIAAPIPLAISAEVSPADAGIQVMIPAWQIKVDLAGQLDPTSTGLKDTLDLILAKLNLQGKSLTINVSAHIPHSSGLGASAALSVALIRALSAYAGKTLKDEAVNTLAYACEQIAHETPSGIDNSVATFGQFLLYRKGEQALIEPIKPPQPIELVIALSGVESSTGQMVAQTRRLWEKAKSRYNTLFDQIDALVLSGVNAIKANDIVTLGQCMNSCQAHLQDLQVSSPALEQMIELARRHGALGAKLTGSGGGGAMIALCENNQQEVARALNQAGFNAMEVTIG